MEGAAHLVSCLAEPFNHFWNGLRIHAAARFANRIDNGEVALQRIERRNGGLVEIPILAMRLDSRRPRTTYIVVAGHSGGCVKEAEVIGRDPGP